MKAFKLKKVIELVKQYQWDSGKRDEEAEQIAIKIHKVYTKREAAIPFKRIKCSFSDHGIESFKVDREGYVVGESRNKSNWMVLWKGNKTPTSYHKSFISLEYTP